MSGEFKSLRSVTAAAVEQSAAATEVHSWSWPTTPLSWDKRLRGLACRSAWKRPAAGLQQPGRKCHGKITLTLKIKVEKRHGVSQQMLCFPRSWGESFMSFLASPVLLHNAYSSNMYRKCLQAAGDGIRNSIFHWVLTLNLEIKHWTCVAAEETHVLRLFFMLCNQKQSPTVVYQASPHITNHKLRLRIMHIVTKPQIWRENTHGPSLAN